MMSIRVRPPWILFLSDKTEENAKFYLISRSCKYDGTYKAYKAPFGVSQLVQLGKVYPDAKVVEGQEHIDALKESLHRLQKGKESYGLVADPSKRKELLSFDFPFSKEKFPMEHQFEGIYYLQNFDGGALLADCGAGKSGIILWDTALKLRKGELKPGQTLIVGKLMTLYSGWEDDAKEFAYLSSTVLWGKSQSKIEKMEAEIVADHGEKPQGKSKKFHKTEYHFVEGGIATLASPRHFNPKKHVRKLREWKQVGDVKYGQETLTTIYIHNIRAANIKEAIANNESDIHIINHEGLLAFQNELTKKNYQMIVIDESTAIKNPQSKIFKALKEIAAGSKYRRILSGTPSPQGPQDLWSQFYFLDKGLTLGPSYQEFLDTHFEVIKLGSVEAGTASGEKILLIPHGKDGKMGTLEYIQSRLQNRVFRCKLRDCVDLPPASTRILDVYLTDELESHYKKMEHDLCVELSTGEVIDVTVDLAKIAKLRQITSGFIINKSKDVISLAKTNPKLEVLNSLLSEINPGPEEKVIIFANYRAEIEMLRNKFGTFAEAIYGGSGGKGREAQTRFLEDPTCHYLICQPASAAYGVNKLTIARHMIFYSIDYRSDFDYQAKKRIERTGQVRSIFFWYLVAKGTIDTIMYQAIQRKNNVQQKSINLEIVNHFRKNK